VYLPDQKTGRFYFSDRIVRARWAFVVFNAVANFCCHLRLLDTFPLSA
jgi:hypothetical protein